MSGLFDLDNPVMRFLFKICDLMILNVIFILSCIPIFTVGAALSALYTMSFQLVRREDGYIVKGYFNAFRKNFKQGTILWIGSAAIFFFLWYDYLILTFQNTAAFQVFRVLLFMVILVAAAVFLYIWPITAHFVCTTGQILKNAVYISIGFLPWTLVLFLYYGLIAFLMSLNPIFFWLITGVSMICGFSVTAYLTTLIFNRIFRKYE